MSAFEIMCVSMTDSCVMKTDAAVCYSLMANSSLFGAAKLLNQNCVHDDARKINVRVSHVENSEEDTGLRRAFLVRATASFKEMEPFRVSLVQHLKRNAFEHIYVLEDEVSSDIAKELYPSINKVENLLRKYVLKFFVTKLGPNWWNVTADAEMQRKVVQRKNNETVFSELADGKAYLIDFGELGRIVYAQSSGFISRNDVFSRVMALEETGEAVRLLKAELQSNYNKFFKEYFKDKNFQQKWEELEKIRHKVAHNGLFVQSDLAAGKNLCDELNQILATANSSIDKVTFSVSDRDAITDSIVTTTSAHKVISPSQFLKHLEQSEKWAVAKEGFLSLHSFVRFYLGGELDFDFGASYEVARQLANEGTVEIYEHKGQGHARSVKAIRLVDGIIQPHRPLGSLGELLKDQQPDG